MTLCALKIRRFFRKNLKGSHQLAFGATDPLPCCFRFRLLVFLLYTQGITTLLLYDPQPAIVCPFRMSFCTLYSRRFSGGRDFSVLGCFNTQASTLTQFLTIVHGEFCRTTRLDAPLSRDGAEKLPFFLVFFLRSGVKYIYFLNIF